MFEMTDAAKYELSRLLLQEQADQDVAVRLVIRDDKVVPALDRPADNDTRYEHNGQTVLCLDRQIYETLRDRTLDVDDASSLLLR